MAAQTAQTGLARLSPGQARAVLLGFALLTVFCLAAVLFSGQDWNGDSRPGPGDVALYRAVVERVHAGEAYHDANFAERTARGYPLRSVFNCRMPLPFWLLGHLPQPDMGKWLLLLLALLAAGMLFTAIVREDAGRPGRALASLVLLAGPLGLCGLGEIYLMPVLWSGVFVALSLGLDGVGRPRLGVAAGIAALFMRELALPYCLLAAGLAWQQRRRGEALLWAAGLAAWLGFFAWHYGQVLQRVPAGAAGHSASWVQLGGAAFVLSTVRMNAYLLVCPPWAAAIYFAAALIGLAGWNSRLGTRVGLTVCLYVAGLAVVGLPVNAYWGLMIAPLVCLGAARFPWAIGECWSRGCLARPLVAGSCRRNATGRKRPG